MASYPDDVPVFSTKRDLIDDVMAAHVNDLQSEIVAVEEAVGLNPAHEPDYPGDRAVTYGSLSERVHGVARGDQTLVSSMTHGAGLWVPKSPGPSSINLIELPNFYRANDPFRMGVQWGVVLPEDGWWAFDGHLAWQLGSSSGLTVRKISIQVDHSTHASQSFATPGNAHCTMQVSLKGFYARGTKIGLAAGLWMTSTSEGGLGIQLGGLTAVYLRAPVEL